MRFLSWKTVYIYSNLPYVSEGKSIQGDFFFQGEDRKKADKHHEMDCDENEKT